jgi:hypothetical protein
MSEHALFEYRAKLMSGQHAEEQGEPIHCLIKMKMDAGHGRSRELLEQEAGDLLRSSSRLNESPSQLPVPCLAGSSEYKSRQLKSRDKIGILSRY